MSDPYIAMIYLSFFVLGLTSPFVLTLGYAWVDTFYPQIMSTIVEMVPSSLLIAIGAISLYLILDRKFPPRFSTHTALTLMFAFWMTISLSWAVVPDFAYLKWNWAVKTVLFSTFVPLVLRSRVQIEAFLGVFLFAITLHMLPRGMKDLLSGSSYGRDLGIINSNMLLLESSTLAMVSIALIPIILFLGKHSLIIPKWGRVRTVGSWGMVIVAVACAISTYARTALIGFVVVGVFMFLQTKRKMLFGVCAAVMVVGFSAITANSWNQRIDTTADYDQEDSALGRILVWKWTLAYSFQHPFGGGFDAYRTDHIEFPAANGVAAQIVHGKAYHNMYFEVLGELGYPGLIMFVSIQMVSLLYLWNVSRRTREKPYQLWLHDLANACITSLLVLMTCGNFIGVGFQAQLWYFVALPVCLREYLRRVDLMENATQLPHTQRTRATALMPLPRPAR